MAKTALITGASSGLGLELAQLFAADKHDLVLVARRRDRLEELATRLAAERGVVAGVISADLADPGAPQRIVDELKRRGADDRVPGQQRRLRHQRARSSNATSCASWRWCRSTSRRWST